MRISKRSTASLFMAMFLLVSGLAQIGASQVGDTTELDEPTLPDAIADNAFVENKGQWDDALMFIARTGFGHVSPSSDGVYYNVMDRSMANGPVTGPDGMKDLLLEARDREHVEGAVVKVSFEGANLVTPTAYDQVSDNINFILGDDASKWTTGVRSYGSVGYIDLWDGIDLMMAMRDGGLKYDIVLHPGSDPSDIAFRVEGHSGLEVKGTDLVIHTPVGKDITDSGLCANYMDGENEVIWASFVLRGDDRYGISFGAYDSSRPVLVDPLVFSTYYGGTSYDTAQDLDMDRDGNLYVTGYTDSYDFPITKGAYQTSNMGYTDVIVFKMSGDGRTIYYSTYIGGTDSDFGGAIEVDGSGNAYVTGGSYSLDFPTTEGAFNETHWNTIDYMDVIVLKLDPRGSSLVFSTYVAGEYDDAGLDLAIDDVGSCYVVGISDSEKFPTTSGAYDESFNGFFDIILFMLSYTGGYLKYSTYFGGDDFDVGSALFFESNGAIYLTGSTYSLDFPVTGNVRNNGGLDAFAAKMDFGNATLTYSTLIGGDDDEEGTGIGVDDQGNAYVCGYTYGGSRVRFPTTAGAYDTSFNGVTDIFSWKVDKKASTVYSTFVGGTDEDWAYDIRVDTKYNAYICGYTYSTDFPATPGADYTSHQGGNNDAVVFELDSKGASLLYSTYLGGNYDEYANSIYLDPNDKVLVAGETGSKNYPTTTGVVQNFLMGDYDCFVTKLNLLSLPTEPRSVMAYGGVGYVLVNWTEPASNGGAPILFYRIYKGLTDASLNLYMTTSNLVLNDTTVNAGTTYYYAVSANNTLGEGPLSPSVSAMPKGRPSVPRSLNVIAGETYVDLDWDAPLLTGGSPLTGYWVYRGPAAGSLVRLKEVSPANTYHRDEEVQPGMVYFYHVTASNLVGESDPTDLVEAIMPDVPTAPRNLTAKWGDRFIQLDWEAPSDDGGIPLHGYRVFRADTLSAFKILVNLTDSVLTYNDTTVTNGVTYTYNMTAFNNIGSSPQASITTAPYGRPDKPRVLPPASGDGYVHLHWQAPDIDGGSVVLGYRTYLMDELSQLQFVKEVGPDVFDSNMTELVNGRIYYYYVTCYNAIGESKKSEMMTGLPVGLPDPPLGLEAVAGDGYVYLSWSEPLDNGGSGVLRYYVLRGTEQADWHSYLEMVNQSLKYYNDTTVTNGVTYKYVVRAMTTIGLSEPSIEVSATPLGVPSPPRNLSLSPGNRFVLVSWLPPEKDGGSPVLSYDLHRGEAEAMMETVASLGPGSLSYNDTNVTNGKVYYYRLMASNTLGPSMPTQIATARPLGTPSAPRNVRVETSGPYIKVLWDPPEDTGGTSITGYNIYRSDNGGEMELVGSVGPGINTFLDREVEPGVEYEYTVRATNSVGDSSSSASASIKIKGGSDDDGSLGWLLWLVMAMFAIAIVVALVLFLVLRRKRLPEQAPPPVTDQSMAAYPLPPEVQPMPVPPAPEQQQLYPADYGQPLMQVPPPAPIPELGPAPMVQGPESGPSEVQGEAPVPQEASPTVVATAQGQTTPEPQPTAEAQPQQEVPQQ